MNPEETMTPSALADQFVADEIARTRKGVRQTQIFGTAVFLFVAFYIGSIAVRFQRSLEPSEAATIAKGLVEQHVNDGAPEFTAYLKREVPAIIEKAPDYVMQELPNYRAQLEDRLEEEFRGFTSQTSSKLSTELDQYLSANQEQFKTVILTGQDPEATRQMAANLRAMFVEYLSQKSDGDESIQQKLDASLEALGKIKAMTKRLAAGKDLTEPEKKTRRAIAVLLTTIDRKKAEDPMPSSKEFQDAARQTLNTDAVNGLGSPAEPAGSGSAGSKAAPPQAAPSAQERQGKAPKGPGSQPAAQPRAK